MSPKNLKQTDSQVHKVSIRSMEYNDDIDDDESRVFCVT